MKSLKKFLHYEEPQQDERKQTLILLEELIDRMEVVESEISDYVNLKTLRLDLKIIKEHEDHGENQLLQDVKENVAWLKQARLHLASGMNEIRGYIKESTFFGSKNDSTKRLLAFRKSLLALDDIALFSV